MYIEMSINAAALQPERYTRTLQIIRHALSSRHRVVYNAHRPGQSVFCGVSKYIQKDSLNDLNRFLIFIFRVHESLNLFFYSSSPFG